MECRIGEWSAGQNEDTGMCAQLLRRVRLFATPWTVTHQVPLSMEFPRQAYWSELPFPSPFVKKKKKKKKHSSLQTLTLLLHTHRQAAGGSAAPAVCPEGQPPRTAPGQGAVCDRTTSCVIREGIQESSSQHGSLAREALHSTQVPRLYPTAYQKICPPQRARLRSTDKGRCSTLPGRAPVEILR